MKSISWVQGMKSGFAAASIGPARPTSVDESLLWQRAVDVAVQKALEEQRERIAANLDKLAKINERNGGGTIAAIMYHVASAIRRGEIGGEQSAKGETA